MLDDLDLVAIIPAAGVSQRLRPSGRPVVPKQFQRVCSQPLIYHTATAFLALPWIGRVVVVAAPDSVAAMETALAPCSRHYPGRLECVPGGPSRHRSIREAMCFLAAGRLPDLVVVHDGARPLLDEMVLRRLVAACLQNGAAGAVRPLTSTVLRPAAGDCSTLAEVPDRSQLVASETPQVFRYGPLARAYARCSDHDLDHGTECLDLVLRYGDEPLPPALVPVDAALHFKVTYRSDLYAADGMLKQRRNISLHFENDAESSNIESAPFTRLLRDDLAGHFGPEKSPSAGTVHVLLHYCRSPETALERNLPDYENLVYLLVLTDQLTDANTGRLLRWSRAVRVEKFYLVVAHVQRLAEEEGNRVRKLILYLARELPAEMTGQTFFV